MKKTIGFRVNGQSKVLDTEEDRTLLWVLRTDLGLTGTKYGCGIGVCGSCTVLVDGEAVRSCETSLGKIQGKEILTIEGLAHGGKLHPVQEAFLEEGAVQCGYCTGGMILRAVSLLEENDNPSDQEIAHGMNGNLCRCNGYPKIVNAVRRAAEMMKR